MGDLIVGPDRLGRQICIVGGRVVSTAGGAERLPCPEGEIGPGEVDAHTHLYSGLASLGLPAPEPPPTCFLEILERLWWRLDRALDPALIAISARLHVAEALLNGTTTLIDHHESPEHIEGSLSVLAGEFDRLGARGVLCYGATGRNEGEEEAMRGLHECRRFAETLGSSERIRALVGLHASFTVSDATLRATGQLCRALNLPLHVHLAEDEADVVHARAHGHAGPLERLLAMEALPIGSLLAHGVRLSPEQVRRARTHGAWFIHNPRSNEGNKVGFAASLSASDRVAFGTDGWQADMRAERAAGLRLGLSRSEADARLTAGRRLAAWLFRRPGEDAPPAPLEPGSLGDLVVRDSMGSPQHVVVGGRLVVRDGALVHGDLSAIRAAAAAALPRLLARMTSP